MSDVGDWVSDLFGSENEHKSENVTPEAKNYAYGGEGGANEAANRYRQTAEQAQNRQGVNVNYDQANVDRALGRQARTGQSALAQAMQARAMGQTPSIAGMQANENIRQLQQGAAQQSQAAQAAQASQAASARGAAGVALAGQNAANNIANAQGAIGRSSAQAMQGISNQAQINAANERMQAEQSAFGAYSGMRGGDLASQQQAAQQTQYQAQLQDAQRGRNDQMTMGMSQLEHGVRSTELAAQQNFEAQKAGNRLGAEQINSAVEGQNAATDQKNAENAFGMVEKGAGAIATSSDVRAKIPAKIPARADGGPVSGGRPYLVGERGPEIIVPQQSGTVVPHERLSPADLVTSTWGTGRGVTEEDMWDARHNADMENRRSELRDMRRDDKLHTSGGLAVAGFTPGIRMSAAEPLQRMDDETVALAKAKQAEGLELSEDEQRKAASAQHRQGQTKKAEPPPGAGGAKPTVGGVLSSMGNETMSRASKIDNTYHGPSGYTPAHLIPLPGRADGGPVSAGQPYMVGERGPEMLVPLSGGMSRMGGTAPNPVAHSSALGRLGDVHALPSVGSMTQHQTPGIAKAMVPGSATLQVGAKNMMMSDERAKRAAFEAGAAHATKHLTGEEMRPWDDAPDDDEDDTGISDVTELPGWKPAASPHPLPAPPALKEDTGDTYGRAAMRATARAERPMPEREPTPAVRVIDRRVFGNTPHTPKVLELPPELVNYGRQSISDERAKDVRSERDPIADANRSMKGSAYTYKPGLGPPEQDPGELNVGPMAQNLEKSPVAATAVKTDPETGLKMIDQGKALKVVMSGLADLQRQQDRMHATLASRMRGKK